MNPTRMYIIALGLLAGIHWPMLSPLWFPMHDGLSRYQIFRMAYSEYLLQGGWPAWIPRVSWGIPADFALLGGFTPATWLSAWIGSSLKITDALLVYQGSLFLESLFYMSGLFLLSHILFNSNIARMFVIMSGILSISWWSQPFFAFYIYYALPWMFYLLLMFFRTGDTRLFWMAGWLELITYIGNVGYLPPAHLLIFIIIGITLFAYRPNLLKNFWRQPALPYLLVFLLLLAGIAMYILEASDSMVYLSRGGRNEDGSVSLESFITSGRVPLSFALSSLFFGASIHYDQHYYVGIFPWLLFGYGLFKVRHPFFKGISLSILTLFLLGIGGLVTCGIYLYFPGMKWFRHIMHLYYILAFLVLLASGFGLDHWLKSSPQSTPNRIRFIQVMVVVLVLITFEILLQTTWILPDKPKTISWVPNLEQVVSLRVTLLLALIAGLYLAKKQTRWRWPIGGLLMAGVCIDLMLFQYHNNLFYHQDAPSLPETLRQVRPLSFAERRENFTLVWSQNPVQDVPENIYLIAQRKNILYDNTQFLEGPEWCVSPFLIAVLTKKVGHMIKLRGGPLEHKNFRQFFDKEDPNLRNILGCSSPKLWTKETAIFRADTDQAEDLFAQTTEEFPLIVTDGPHPPPETLTEAPSTANKIDGAVLHYSSNHLIIDIHGQGEKGAWLYYADSWSPHWRATVDGKQVPVYRANVGFKAIRLPAGSHRIHWVYFHPRQNLLIHVISLVGIFFSLFWIGFMLWWLRHHPIPAEQEAKQAVI